MKALPHERALMERYEGRPFTVVGFNMDDLDDFDGDLTECFKEHQINFPNFITADDLTDAWELTAGQYVLIDHRGVNRKIGVVKELHEEDVEKEIEYLVQQAENDKS